MKLTALSYPVLLALIGCSANSTLQQQSPEARTTSASTSGYVITDLGPANSPFSQATWINNGGTAVGLSIGADGASHAFVWPNGTPQDISQPGLGGPNTAAFSINASGEVIGQAETAIIDPNNENFCAFGTGLQCLAFLWRNGAMTALQPLGGTNSSVGAINNRGEVTGYAETANRDSECPGVPTLNGTGPQQLDFEAVVWDPQSGRPRQLSPLPGDSVGVAEGINDVGQVVGASGRCGNTELPGFVAAPHAVLWDTDGTVHDLGSFGGTSNPSILAVGNAALSINNSGTVVGTSALPGNQENQPFIWTPKTGMQHLPLLQGDVVGAGLSINSQGQVSGASITQGGPATGTPKAVVWLNGADGPVTDLNDYAAGSPFEQGLLLTAFTINDAGQVVGFGLTSDGNIHGFLATPCNLNSPHCQAGTAHAKGAATLSGNARRQFIQLGGRGH